MIIRPVHLEDARRLVELGEAIRYESTVYFPPPELARVEQTISGFSQHPHAFLRVAEENRIIGLIVASLKQHIFSSVLVSGVDLWFVEKKSRGTWAAPLLVKSFMEWSRSKGATKMTIGVHSGIATERTGMFLETMGFSYMGGSYSKDG